MSKTNISGISEDDAKEDVILDGIKATADYVETNVKDVKEELAKLRDEKDTLTAQLLKADEKHQSRLQEAVGVLNEKIEKLVRINFRGMGSSSLFSAGDALKAGIADEDRKYIALAEMTARESVHPDGTRVVKAGRLSDPTFKAATILWLRDAAALQLKGYQRDANKIHERMAKLEAAFADAYSAGIDELSEGADPGGGYLVPAPIEAEVLRLIEDHGVMRPLVRKVTMTSKTVDIPQKGNAITAYIGAEEATLTGSYDQTAFSNLTLTAKRFHGRATTSIELMQDSIIGLGDYILTTLAEEIAILEDQQALEGDGTNFTGVNAAANVNSVATTTTDGEAIVYSDLTATVWKARQRASRIAARWFAAPEIFGALEGLTDSNGQPIVRYGQVQNGLIRNLLGFPIEPISTLDIAITRGGTSNTANMYFGNPTSVIFGDRMGMSFDVSDAPNWEHYKMDMRLVKRTAIGVGVPTAWTKLVGGTY